MTLSQESKDTIMYGKKIINLLSQWVQLHADMMSPKEISKIADASDVIERIIDDITR